MLYNVVAVVSIHHRAPCGIFILHSSLRLRFSYFFLLLMSTFLFCHMIDDMKYEIKNGKKKWVKYHEKPSYFTTKTKICEIRTGNKRIKTKS